MANSGLFATKPIDKLVADTKEGVTLNRSVGLLDLTALASARSSAPASS